MRKQSIVNRPYALDAVEDYRIKATPGMDSAIDLFIDLFRRVLLSSREVICGEIGYMELFFVIIFSSNRIIFW